MVPVKTTMMTVPLLILKLYPPMLVIFIMQYLANKQWGYSDSIGTKTFPVSFASACYIVEISKKDDNSNFIPNAKSYTKTNFDLTGPPKAVWVAVGK